MLLKRIKLLSIFLIAGIIFGSISSTVFAAYSTTPYYYFAGNYFGFASIDDSKPMTAGALVQIQSGTAGVGEMGARATLLKNGAVCSLGSYKYNTSGTNVDGTTTANCGSGNYQGSGSFAIYKNGVYNYYQGSGNTPIIQH